MTFRFWVLLNEVFFISNVTKFPLPRHEDVVEFNQYIIESKNIKIKKMKKLLIGILVITITTKLFPQDPVSELFNQYEGQEGFTTVNVSGELFEMLKEVKKDSCTKELLTKITEIKILAQEDECNSDLNFHELVYDKLDKNEYKELIVVRESDEKVDILAKEKDGIITDVLLIASGKDNALISIKGVIHLNELDDLDESVKIKGLEKLDMLEENHN